MTTTAPRVEPRLSKALALDGRPDELLDVVVKFNPAGPLGASEATVDQRAVQARAMREQIQQVLERVNRMAGEEPARITPFPLLSGAFVQAHRRYLRTLLAQREVTGAMLNKG